MPNRTLLSKIKSPRALKLLLKKTPGQKVVFTNGCFDLIHPGHVLYLEKAARLGDCLVVALNSDDSVKRLKGKGRPLNELKHRMTVLAALQSVTYVTWFSEDTPLDLIESLRPQILVKGGDWKKDQIVGAKETLIRGGKVFSISYILGKSTTQMIKKAKES